MMMARASMLFRVICGVLLLAPSPAIPRTFAPSAVISVLVDLSKTWHNPQSSAYNQQLLGQVGRAVVGASQRLPKPVAVRHYVIGSASLARPPLCNIMYRPSLIGFGDAESGVQSNFRQFTQYVAASCPRLLLAQPYEPMTEIAAAITTALDANAMVAPDVSRVMVLLSDFKEESAVRTRLARSGLKGVRVILLWRTLPEDRREPSGLTKRVNYWKQFVRGHGGTAYAFADTAVANSPAELQALIVGP